MRQKEERGDDHAPVQKEERGDEADRCVELSLDLGGGLQQKEIPASLPLFFLFSLFPLFSF